MTKIPTTDLYFLNACGKAVNGWLRQGTVRRIGKNCFEAGDAVLLIRRDDDQLMRNLRYRTSGRLFYLVDDDIEAAKLSPSLPPDYRDRLVRFHEEHHRALAEQASTLIVTSVPLMEKFSWHPDVQLLHPVWHLPLADDRHFDGLDKGGKIRAVHLGSGSHAAGLSFLKPIIAALLDMHERFDFTYVGRNSMLGDMDRHPRIHRIRPRAWPRYKRWIRNQRFHLGLYPLPNTPFDKARSHNKLLEHGVVGAVGMYSSDWPASKILDAKSLSADGSTDQWIDMISSRLAQPENLRQLILHSRPVLTELNDHNVQRNFWSELFGITL